MRVEISSINQLDKKGKKEWQRNVEISTGYYRMIATDVDEIKCPRVTRKDKPSTRFLLHRSLIYPKI